MGVTYWSIYKKPTFFKLLKINRNGSKILEINHITGKDIKDKYDQDRISIKCDVYNNGETYGSYYLLIGDCISEEEANQLLLDADKYTNGNYYYFGNYGGKHSLLLRIYRILNKLFK